KRPDDATPTSSITCAWPRSGRRKPRRQSKTRSRIDRSYGVRALQLSIFSKQRTNAPECHTAISPLRCLGIDLQKLFAIALSDEVFGRNIESLAQCRGNSFSTAIGQR